MAGLVNVGVNLIRYIPAPANVRRPNRPNAGMMEMEDNSLQSRSISFDAATLLKSAGYESVRVAGPARQFDLIAWKKDTILFLVLKRSRATGISGYTDEVFHLVDLVKVGNLPGMVQFWIYLSQSWVRYQIMPGGAFPIQEVAL